jgi:hypothetical protein
MVAARLKRTALLKMALVAIVLAGTILGLAAPGKAQSEALPDLTVVKTRYFVNPVFGSCGDPLTSACWQMPVSNIGSGDAVVPAGNGDEGPVLLRDVMNYRVGEVIPSGFGSTGNWCLTNDNSTAGTEVSTLANCLFREEVISPFDVEPILLATNAALAPGVESATIRNCATVDPDNVIEESDESNNTSCVVTVLGSETPTSKAECKNGGWREFGYKNQGQCVAFVQRGTKTSQ